ncbi:hypothetical protein C2857_001745 [Epichloe festucae Fl1]|uniref:Uncharacterized protein n=1 Tax=Epichloe festucae (strain Fl1) TaxID=877507 RepID=A0A7U3SMX7_EPIFF|nr:hypothetical protein C2857_001745 [Epichloe festucae Fl1]
MKFVAITLLAVATAVMAASQNEKDDLFIRQEVVVDTQLPSMTDKQGNVVPFNVNGVNMDDTDADVE